MANSTHNIFAVAIVLVCVTMASLSLSTATLIIGEGSHYSSLATRLKLDDGSANCWDSLYQLQACTGEVITFFINGETYLGPSCCQAIRIVGHDCWPNMLASLGFTSQEGDVLQDYCDSEQQQQQPAHSPPPPSSPNTLFRDIDDATKVFP